MQSSIAQSVSSTGIPDSQLSLQRQSKAIQRQKSILLLCDWFAPGIRAGGPITSCVNFAYAMRNDFHIRVLTSDRDLGEKQTYQGLKKNCWVAFDHGIEAFYCSPGPQRFMKIRDILKRSSSDTLYLNGMFSRAFTLLPLWMHWKKTIDTRIVLAPRGMLRGSALQIKSWKKNGFLHLFKHAGISQRVRFHATDESEREDIYRIFGKNVFVHVLPNCVRSQAETFKRVEKRPGQLKVISVGRIHPIKNTRYLIDVLSHVRHPAQLDLYGPIEDPGYWKACCRRISELPKHVSVVHRGILPANQIRPTLDRYHLFALPTTGENFGHAIYEALASGKPVLISDQTPWRNLQASQAGWDLPLTCEENFSQIIDQCSLMDNTVYAKYAAGAHQLAAEFALSQQQSCGYQKLFGE